jgi:chromatin remodeling complex protein RSC6
MSVNGDEESVAMELSDTNATMSKMVELDTYAQNMLVSIYNLKMGLKSLEANLRNYQKESKKLFQSMKAKPKKIKSAKVGGAVDEKKERKPTGFFKKSKIRKELIDFFNNPEISTFISLISAEEKLKEDSKFEEMDENMMISRPSATKIINRYIKEKKLENPQNSQYIIPDDKLKKLLTPLETTDKKSGGYRYFNLQKYIKHLFYK